MRLSILKRTLWLRPTGLNLLFLFADEAPNLVGLNVFHWHVANHFARDLLALRASRHEDAHEAFVSAAEIVESGCQIRPGTGAGSMPNGGPGFKEPKPGPG